MKEWYDHSGSHIDKELKNDTSHTPRMNSLCNTLYGGMMDGI